MRMNETRLKYLQQIALLVDETALGGECHRTWDIDYVGILGDQMTNYINLLAHNYAISMSKRRAFAYKT